MKTLEGILQELGCKKPFLNEVKVNTDMNEVVERLDDIANEMY